MWKDDAQAHFEPHKQIKFLTYLKSKKDSAYVFECE